MAHAQKPAKGAGGGKAVAKGKKAAGGGGGKVKVEDDREETLQAVVWDACCAD
jgi:hypothetical protein